MLTFKYATETVNCGNSEPLVTVSSDGIVKAGSMHGDATVIVTLEEPFGVVQNIAILVEVR